MKAPRSLLRLSLAVVLLLAVDVAHTASASPSTPNHVLSARQATTTKCSAKKPCPSGSLKYCNATTKLCTAQLSDGKKCTSNAACLNGLCQTTGTCMSTELANGRFCSTDKQCRSVNCNLTLTKPICAAKVANGLRCVKNNGCLSGRCNRTRGVCQPITTTSTKKTSTTSTKKVTTSSRKATTSTSTLKTSTTTTKQTTLAPTTTTTTSSSTMTTSTATTTTIDTTTTTDTTTTSSTASTSTTTTTPEAEATPPTPEFSIAGPYQACTVQGGCLGDGAFICRDSICKPVGGYLEPCRADGTCPSGQNLYCAAADGICYRRTDCFPECEPTTQACLSYTVEEPGMSYGAFQCVDTSGGVGETCFNGGRCKDSTVVCDSFTNKCKAVEVSATTPVVEEPAPTTCTPACNSSKQVCKTYITNSGTTYACQAAGARGQSCLDDGTCSSERLQCNSRNICEARPQTTCDPACSADQICDQKINVFTCVAAGGLGQSPYVNGTCNPYLAISSTTGLCDLLPAGSVCTSDSQCLDPTVRCRASEEDSEIKTCTQAGLAGLACSRSGSCDSSSYCYNVTDTCNAFGKAGDSCPGEDDAQCVEGLQCLSKVCTRVGQLRLPCFSNTTCSGDLLSCDSDTSTCLYSAPVGAGEECIEQSDCNKTTRCTLQTNGTATCALAGTTGLPCLATGLCSDSSACIADTCRAYGAVNATCSAEAPCIDGTRCMNVTTIRETPSSSGGSTRRDTRSYMNLGTQPLAPWHPIWNLPRDLPEGESGGASTTTNTTVQQCIRVGYVNDTCFSNNTCLAAQGAICNTTSNTCGVYRPKLNESCTQDGVNNPTGNVTCSAGLRCYTVPTLVRLDRTFAIQNISTCQSAGALNEKCLINSTTSTSYCNRGLSCSSETSAGKCLLNIGQSCAVANISQCVSGSICSPSEKVCTSVGGLNEECIGGSVCNAGLRCNNSTGTPTCLVRNNASCEDFGTYNLTRICPECVELCELSEDSETVSCSFPAGIPYNFTVPRGISNVTISAGSGAGGNATVYTANLTAIWNSTTNGSTIATTTTLPTDTTDTATTGTITATLSTSTSTSSPEIVIINGTAYLNNTNITVPLVKNATTFGGVGATFSSWMMLVANRTYMINAGGMGNQYQGGYNGGGLGYYDERTNSSSGGGGGRTEIFDSVNGSRLLCLGGGGGGGYLWGGGAAMANGNGTNGFGLAGASNSTSGADSTGLGLGAGGGGCNGGTAAFSAGSGAGGGGGNSDPSEGVKIADFLKIGNVTLKLAPSGGFVGLSFSCPIESF